ncbi:outer membrane protein assembly factor BamD [bacterium]|nr:outer membrane protein assembly factor BamD [bacterium]
MRFGRVLGLVAGLFLASCASQEVNPDDPDSVFSEAERLYTDKQYLLALERYRDIKSRFPYSPRATDAELRIADTYYAQDSFLEAESSYEIFRELHPSYPKSDYVQYQIAMSYFMLVPENSARDLSAAYRSIDAFQLLKQRFPDSSYVAEADKKIIEARHRLAEHENYVADFYFNRRHYLSASYRYAALLKEFAQSGYDEEALYRLGQCYYNIRMYDSAKDTLDRLMREFPQTGYLSSAQSLMSDIEKKN